MMQDRSISELLDMAAVANRLGVSVRTVRNWLHGKNPIPFYRLAGRTVRFKWPEVEVWVESFRSTAKANVDVDTIVNEVLTEMKKKPSHQKTRRGRMTACSAAFFDK